MFAAAFREPTRLHPVVCAGEEDRIVRVDMLVAHEGPQQLVRLQRAVRVRRTWWVL